MWSKVRFYIQHSFNDLQVNRRRTLFALLCIAAGVAAIVSLQTLGDMINATLTGSLQEANKGDIRISSAAGFTMSDELVERGRDEGVLERGGMFFPDHFSAEGTQIIRDWFADRDSSSVVTLQQRFSDLTTGSAVSNPVNNQEQTMVSLFIVEAEYYPLYGTRDTLDGEPLRAVLREPTDTVISMKLADELGVTVGDRIRVSGASVDFTVRGIVPKDAEGGLDENMLAGMFGFFYLDVRAGDFFGQEPDTYDLYARLDDPEQAEAINAALEADFPYVTTSTTQDLKERNSQVADVLNDLVTIMGLVSLLIGGIGIVNTMLVIVSRRTMEVAVLKTVGLEPHEVSLLFLVEAILMGIAGSLVGVILGWGLAWALQSVAESFLAQSLTFTISPSPAITGLVVGVVITTIFGILPTLAAGRIRPGLVLRPAENMIPRAGRLLSFLALLAMLVVITLVVRGLVGDLLDADMLRGIAGVLGAVLGVISGLAIVVSGPPAQNWLWRGLRWALWLGVLAVAGYLFGWAFPALLLVTGVAVEVTILYAVLWLLIWAMGGGSFSLKGMMANLPPLLKLAALPFLAMLPFMLWPILLLWGIGRLIQRLGFVDLKIAMRSMLATKGRGASTLLALVVGVFTLSLITMLVDSITKQFEVALEREAGGNVLVISPGYGRTLEQIETVLAAQPGVHSFAAVGSYDVQLVSAQDAKTGEVRSFAELKEAARAKNEAFGQIFDFSFELIDARELGSNLPDVKFYRGRQLNLTDDGQLHMVMEANQATLAAGLDVGDQLSFEVLGRAGQVEEMITLEVVGMIDRRFGGIQTGGSTTYVPLGVLPETVAPTQVNAVVDIDEDQVDALRDALEDVPGAFVLETRFINDVINRIVDQFTAFPILVAALALFTGGIVIANSVALSTLERRREIGIMKAIGLQRERVLGMLLLENALMGFIGGLIGVGTGVVILLSLMVGMFQGQLGDAIPFGTAFGLMALCVGIALVAAVVSVWGASGEKPLNVLRYE